VHDENEMRHKLKSWLNEEVEKKIYNDAHLKEMILLESREQEVSDEQ
jgi:hypothetical protein